MYNIVITVVGCVLIKTDLTDYRKGAYMMTRLYTSELEQLFILTF
jgi:hypothetical protein